MEPCFNNPFSDDIVNIENVILLVLLRQRGRRLRRYQRLRGFVIGLVSRHGDKLFLRVTERRQLAAEHTSGIDIDGAVQPLRLTYWRVPIDHRSLAAIICRPVVANREPEFIRFSCGLTEESERTNSSRTAPLHLFLHSRVGYDQLALIKDVMTNETIEEISNLALEFRWFDFKLRN